MPYLPHKARGPGRAGRGGGEVDFWTTGHGRSVGAPDQHAAWAKVPLVFYAPNPIHRVAAASLTYRGGMRAVNSASTRLISADQALPGRQQPSFEVPRLNAVLGGPLQGPWPDSTQVLYLALGCFWGAERIFWQLPGVVNTAVGYQGGFTPFPTYDETCTGQTGHTEAVLVAYDPQLVTTAELLRRFWESHDPTQGFRQGNDRGSQYRSAIYWTTEQQEKWARATQAEYQRALSAKNLGTITTELRAATDAGPFYFAEEYHQQYLHKVPGGYCGIGGTGVSCPTPAG